MIDPGTAARSGVCRTTLGEPVRHVRTGVHTRLLALTAGLAFAFLAGAPAANAGEREHAMKHGSQPAQDGRHGARERHARGEHSKGRHHGPGEVVECGDLLSEAGNYSLNSDLVCTSPIKVTGSNVHLDLAGHRISCDAENWEYADPASDPSRYQQIVTAIFVNADSAIEWDESGGAQEDLSQAPVLTGFKVKNGTISDCTFGISLFKTDRSKVTNMHMDGNTVARPEFNNDTVGILAFASNDNHFIGNHVSGGSLQGFELLYSNGNRLLGNVLEGMGDDGIFLIGSSENVLQHNTTIDGSYGIYLQPDFFWFVYVSSGNVIKSNKVSGNAVDGITLLGPSNGNVVRGNAVTDNGGVGVLLQGLSPFGLPFPAGNTMRGNTVFRNAVVDLAEIDLDENFEPVVPAECSNLWEHNAFDTAIGPEMCIE